MYNPGISEKQWRKLMAFIARMNEKYAQKLLSKEKEFLDKAAV